MANVNTTVLSGSIAADPDLRWISEDGETGITRLGLIVKKSRKLPEPLDDGTEWEETSSIFDVEVYGGFALTIARKLQKFDDVTVSGELVKDEWEDKDSGGKRSRIKITARVIDSPGLFRPKSEDRELVAGQQQQIAQESVQATTSNTTQPATTATSTQPAAATEVKESAQGLTADDIPF
jgi:single-strand DNA-binding protein